MSADVQRTAAAAEHLSAKIIRHLRSSGQTLNEESICLFLSAMLSNWAKQIAKATLLRIPHGSLNCSNITLSGAYIDFGTATSLPDFVPAIVAKGNPPFGDCPSFAKRTVDEIVYSLVRYGGFASHLSTNASKALFDGFCANYERALATYSICLLGVNRLRGENSFSNALIALILRLVLGKQMAPFLLGSKECLGLGLELPKLLRIISICDHVDEYFQCIGQWSSPPENILLARSLGELFFKCKDDLRPRDLSFVCQMRMWGNNQERHSLYKPKLDADIKALSEGGDLSGIADFIEDVVAQCKNPYCGTLDVESDEGLSALEIEKWIQIRENARAEFSIGK
ncbi:hypothetical protein ACG02S_25990 [Roseateles sp. DC23W]|uniref:Uncharacterized protein n=1 Tax=Pelomonas dachongensis TaxID=3299029 RepID=A0ABW7EW52_9BURK